MIKIYINENGTHAISEYDLCNMAKAGLNDMDMCYECSQYHEENIEKLKKEDYEYALKLMLSYIESDYSEMNDEIVQQIWRILQDPYYENPKVWDKSLK